MFYLRRVFQELRSFVGGVRSSSSSHTPGARLIAKFRSMSSRSAIFSNANTILSSRSATFSTGFGSFMSRILSPGPGKNNLSLYVALAGGKP